MTEAAHTRLLRSCYAFLVPIARLLLRAGVNFREFEDLAKLAFVTTAVDQYGLRGRPTNNSRVSAMTGIPRKEVSRIRAERRLLEREPRSELSPLGDVLHQWNTDPAYLDDRGRPLPLPAEGEAPSFSELVRGCAGDLPPGAVRVELLRMKAVIQEHDGTLRVVSRLAIPESIDDRLLTSLSFNLYCLASTIAYNSNPDRQSEGRIERFVQSKDLTVEQKKKLRSFARRRIAQFTEELDDIFSTVGSSSPDANGRIGVGVYYFEDD